MLSKELKKISNNVKAIEISYSPKGNDYYPFFYFLIVLGGLFFMSSGFEVTTLDVDFVKERAIKAVDPLEILKKRAGSPSDRAEF